eukprot:COSAG02_NODE_63284_length_263_cov_1.164634_1_plen_25_part_10
MYAHEEETTRMLADQDQGKQYSDLR